MEKKTQVMSLYNNGWTFERISRQTNLTPDEVLNIVESQRTAQMKLENPDTLRTK